ncbi:MAG: pantoate--beta-alanine ligase [Thermodesulfobacteriota bacterium]
MKVFETADSMRSQVFEWKKKGLSTGFVPTMGFLHEGHLALLEKAGATCDRVVMSIFVNPAQFGEGEDFETYPRDFERDMKLAQSRNADAVFFPSTKEMYPENYQTYVELEKLPGFLCGKSRHGHFKGVATVVSKLFNIVDPDYAFFGEKDFQQLAVIKQMAKDLNFPVQVKGVPIVRENDGLAMSSRNSYLSEDERKNAVLIYKGILRAKELIEKGESDPVKVKAETKSFILGYEKAKTDYITICDPDTLEDVSVIEKKPVLLAVAVYFGKTRLIDNMVITPEN